MRWTMEKQVVGALAFFLILGLYMTWSRLEHFDEDRMGLQAQVEQLTRKRDQLQQAVWEAERNIHRYGLRLETLDGQLRDRLLLLSARKNKSLDTIFFVTPTAFRLEQKADLTRLSQTLAQVPSLFWIVVEDADMTSKSVYDIIKRTRIPYAHLAVKTPSDKKMRPSDPNWLLPRGVQQRNAALAYIRTNFASSRTGIVYFGDDDNVYDWRLFDEMRRVRRAGTWPVGIVGGLVAERAHVGHDGTIAAVNAIWKPERPFALDMAAFAVNVSLVLSHPDASFDYSEKRGMQESHFLLSCGLNSTADLEPLADFASKVYVWHTRTEKAKLSSSEARRVEERVSLEPVERDALGID